MLVQHSAMILGDHPNCRYGPPITIAWDYLEYEPLPLNEYESHHSRRRPIRKLYLFKPKRQKILIDSGHTMREMNKAARACKNAQWKRELTITFLPLDMILSFGRKVTSCYKRK
jgi:hypothetical protein